MTGWMVHLQPLIKTFIVVLRHSAAGLSVDFKTYDGMGHFPTLTVFQDMTAFVTKQLETTTQVHG